MAKSSGSRVLKAVGWGVMFTLALLLFVVASRYLTLDPQVYFPEQREVYIAHTLGIVTHVAGAMVATILGPFQFLPKSSAGRYLRLHRWLGRIYLLGVLVGGVSGLYMSFLAYGGLAARLGFAALAIAWLTCGFTAYRHILNKRIQLHRQWMIRTYALTFAAVTLRIWLPLMVISGLEYDTAYRIVAWLCWVPNLLVAEWIVSRIRPRRPAAAPAFAR